MNAWHQWPPTQNSDAPPGILEPFQDDLNDIAGFAPGGFSRLRLFWGQAMRERDRYPDEADFSTASFMEHRYSIRDLNKGWVAQFPDGMKTYPPSVDPPSELLEYEKSHPGILLVEEKIETIDVGIPRWYIHKWRPHTVVDAASYDADRVAYDVEGNQLLSFAPREMPIGQWAEVVHIVIGEHENECCARARQFGTKCFASYRDPSQVDLDYLAAVWKEKEKQPVTHAEGELCPPWILDMRTQARLSQIADVKQREAAKRRFWVKSMFKEESHRIFGNPRTGYNTATGHTMPTGNNVR